MGNDLEKKLIDNLKSEMTLHNKFNYMVTTINPARYNQKIKKSLDNEKLIIFFKRTGYEHYIVTSSKSSNWKEIDRNIIPKEISMFKDLTEQEKKDKEDKFAIAVKDILIELNPKHEYYNIHFFEENAIKLANLFDKLDIESKKYFINQLCFFVRSADDLYKIKNFLKSADTLIQFIKIKNFNIEIEELLKLNLINSTDDLIKIIKEYNIKVTSIYDLVAFKNQINSTDDLIKIIKEYNIKVTSIYDLVAFKNQINSTDDLIKIIKECKIKVTSIYDLVAFKNKIESDDDLIKIIEEYNIEIIYISDFIDLLNKFNIKTNYSNELNKFKDKKLNALDPLYYLRTYIEAVCLHSYYKDKDIVKLNNFIKSNTIDTGNMNESRRWGLLTECERALEYKRALEYERAFFTEGKRALDTICSNNEYIIDFLKSLVLFNRFKREINLYVFGSREEYLSKYFGIDNIKAIFDGVRGSILGSISIRLTDVAFLFGKYIKSKNELVGLIKTYSIRIESLQDINSFKSLIKSSHDLIYILDHVGYNIGSSNNFLEVQNYKLKSLDDFLDNFSYLNNIDDLITIVKKYNFKINTYNDTQAKKIKSIYFSNSLHDNVDQVIKLNKFFKSCNVKINSLTDFGEYKDIIKSPKALSKIIIDSNIRKVNLSQIYFFNHVLESESDLESIMHILNYNAKTTNRDRVFLKDKPEFSKMAYNVIDKINNDTKSKALLSFNIAKLYLPIIYVVNKLKELYKYVKDIRNASPSGSIFFPKPKEKNLVTGEKGKIQYNSNKL